MVFFPALCNYCQKSISCKTEETDIYLEIPNSRTLFLPHHLSDFSLRASSTACLSQGKHFQAFLRQNGEQVQVTGSFAPGASLSCPAWGLGNLSHPILK